MKRLLILVIFSIFGSLDAIEGQDYENGIILYQDKKMIQGEFYSVSDHQLFLRNREVGRFVSKNDIKGIVDENYVNRILSKDRWQVVSESLYLFSSGNQYQAGSSINWPNEDIITKITKISLVLVSGYFY